MTTNADAIGPAEGQVTYDATEGEENTLGPLRKIAILVVVAAIIGFIYLAYMQGVRNGSVGVPPVVVANEEPYKTAAADPGGKTIENTDKVIYDRVTGAEGETGATKVAEPGEEPVTIVMAPADGDAGPETRPLVMAEIDPAPMTPTPAPKPDGISAAIEKAEAESVAPVATAQGGPLIKPTESVSGVTASIAGAFVVQVASFRDQPSADAAWASLSAKHGDLVGSLTKDLETADVPGKGTFVRLRVGPFSSKEEAQSLCASLKARGQDCMVKKS